MYALLEQAGAALCLPYSTTLPLDARLTTNWTYIRIHGGQHGIGLDDAELGAWADRIRGFRAAGADCYAYFNNDPDGHAVWDAQRLRGMLAS